MKFILICLLFFYFNQINLIGDENYLNYKVESINNQYYLYELINSSNSVIIFLHSNNCHKCLSSLKSMIDSISKYELDFKYIVLVRCANNVIEKKSYIKALSPLFKANQIFFDIHQQKDKYGNVIFKEGLFSLFDLKYTPAILIIKENRYVFKSYYEMFGAK